MTKDEILAYVAEVETRESKATREPWMINRDGWIDGGIELCERSIGCPGLTRIAIIADNAGDGGSRSKQADANAEFIAAARDDVYRLCQIIREQQRGKDKAIELAVRYGGIDGDHHKARVIDQMVRVLTGSDYERVVKEACDGEDGPSTYSWEIGIPP